MAISVINKKIPSPRDIFRNEDDPIFNKLKQKENPTVLDIGSRVPLALAIIYHNFNPLLLKGIDKENNEEICVRKYCSDTLVTQSTEDNRIAEIINRAGNTFYSVYEHDLFRNIEYRKLMIPKEEFDQAITSHYEFNMPIEKYLKLPESKREKFDIIICKNILHFTQQDSKIIKNIVGLLNEDGFIYMRVENQSKAQSEKRRTFYNKELFEQEISENFDVGSLYYTKSEKYKDWHSITFVNMEFPEL